MLKERVRHVRRGTSYDVVGGAIAQASTGPIQDGAEVVVYRGEDGRMWVRERREFEDGRFVVIATVGLPYSGQ